MNRCTANLAFAALLAFAGGLSASDATGNRRMVAAWDFDTATANSTNLATAIQGSRKYNANFSTANRTNPVLVFDGTVGSNVWNSSNGTIWTSSNGSLENLPPGSTSNATSNLCLRLRAGPGLAANGQSLVFEVDMSKSRRLDISYAAISSTGGFATHEWHYWDEKNGAWVPIPDTLGNQAVPVPGDFSTVLLEQVGGTGFNNRPKARVRLRLSGATSTAGYNLIDNIRFHATVAP